ncbi:MAG: tRNA-dihydrouridine synthase, partial [Treponema porcinum]|nr:tRNA-dihydrouridine synthase [Treponema porcinum]
QSFEKVTALCPDCTGVMIGRAAVQKPWIFAEMCGRMSGKSVDLEEAALSFIEDVQRYQPPEFWRTRLQRFFAYYSQNFSFAHYAGTKLMNAKSPSETAEALRLYFSEVPADRTILFP